MFKKEDYSASGYIDTLQRLLFEEVVQNPRHFQALLAQVEVPDNLCSSYARPEKSVVVNTPVGTSVYQVNATDPDQGTGGSVLFSFQPPSPFFSIDGARGTVTVTRALDYESTSAYQLTVNATDQDKKRPLSSLSNLAITITDVQDMDPIFTNLPYSTNIEEDAPPFFSRVAALSAQLESFETIGEK
ncbi:unnamed protein product [Coregonus sp. 'balchen']|nr:unnamed protein product [Coregonus sp. 'balchen']